MPYVAARSIFEGTEGAIGAEQGTAYDAIARAEISVEIIVGLRKPSALGRPRVPLRAGCFRVLQPNRYILLHVQDTPYVDVIGLLEIEDHTRMPTISDDPLTGDILLSAKNGDINLNAATGTSDTSSKNSSYSVGVGVKWECGTKSKCVPGVNVSGSYGKGNDGTTGLTNYNSHVNGTGDVTILTNDLTLRGATVTGNSVTAAVRNLTVESLVDTATAEARQLNLSGSIGTDGFSASGSTQKATGDAAIVSEQSGIHAGTGGLDLTVDKKTTLVGGLLTSEAPASDNHFETGTLEVSDVDTHSRWKADTYGASIGSGGLSLASVKDGERATGKAYSAIGGTIDITITDPTHQTQDIGTIRRDTDNTNTSLPGLPDLQNILRDQYKTQADLQEAQKTMAGLAGDIASELYKQATLNQDQAGMDYWKEGGAGRALLHAIGGGILGGVNGWEGAIKAALGGAATTLMAPAIAELVKGMLKGTKYEGTPEGDALAKLIGATLAAGVGGAVGGAEGAGYGTANYQYNYLNHADNDALNAAKAVCNASKGADSKACGEKTRLEEKDKQQQAEFISCRANNYSGDGCYGVALNVLAAVSSYSGGISYWVSLEDKEAAAEKLVADGSIAQLWKLRAPENYDSLTDAQIKEMTGDLAYILADPFFVNSLPATVKEAVDGNPISALQAVALLTRFGFFGKGAVEELTQSGQPTNGGQTGAGGFSGSADEAYEAIRENTTDVGDIARNTGLKAENIQKVKDHLFLDEHTLDRYVDLGIPAERARFDSDIKIAESWHRLQVGTFTDDDIQLLRHEIAERWIEIKRDCGYCEAHDAASVNFPAPDWWK